MLRAVLLGSIFFFIFSSNAWAKAPGEPAFRAELEELDKDGQPLPPNLLKQSLTMNKRGEKVASFAFTEIFGAKCPPGALCILGYWEVTREFYPVRKSITNCGSTRYQAIELSSKMRPMRPAMIEVVDHSTRMCDDLRRYGWDVKLVDQKNVRLFGGNPKPVGKPNDCGSRNTICTMQFQPSTCVASTWDGEKLREPLKAEGGNPCMAEAALRTAACERGLDPDAGRDEEIICSIQICPAILCAAPPPGCRYEPPQQLNEWGCAVSCGTLKCDGPVPDPR